MPSTRPDFTPGRLASRAAIKRKKASGLVQLSTWVPEELHSPIKQLIATMMNSYRAAQMAAEAEKQAVSPIVQEFQSLGRKITFQASTRTERLTMTFGEVDENEDEHRFSPSNDSFDGLSMEDMAELMADYARNK